MKMRYFDQDSFLVKYMHDDQLIWQFQFSIFVSIQNSLDKDPILKDDLDIDDLIDRLKKLRTEEERINLLSYEYLGLYFLVCRVKGISTKEFREFCKNLDTKNHPELMVFYIHGWLNHHLEELRQQKKLHKGKKEIRIDIYKCQYEGELNE